MTSKFLLEPRDPHVNSAVDRGMDCQADRQLFWFKLRSYFPPSHLYFMPTDRLGVPDRVAFHSLSEIVAVAADESELLLSGH